MNKLQLLSAALLLWIPIALRADEDGVSTISHPSLTSPREPKAFSFLDGTVSFDLYERLRWEDRNNNYDFDSSKRALTDDNWMLLRFRLGMQWTPSNWFRF